MNYCYDYCADRYCEKCGLEIIKQINETEELELTDSNSYPQKNYIGEISPGAPEHCGNCHVFIPAPANEELLEYVRMEGETDITMYGSLRETTALWVNFYKVTINHEVKQ